MRARDFVTELRKKKSAEPRAGDRTPHDFNPGWERLNWLKEQAAQKGQDMAGTFQLFVPRASARAQSPRDRRLKNLANRYAYDDEGNLKPNYDQWEQPQPELSATGQDEVKEAAPILAPGRTNSPPGNNKPQAKLWTSTARQAGNAWISEWAEWTAGEMPDWFSNTGYLYRVQPGALILELNTDWDVEAIFQGYRDLGRVGEPDHEQSYDRTSALRRSFPWDQISRHFDAVTYSGWNREGFMYGWDVESTAWFDTSHLQLVGEVPVAARSGRRLSDDDIFS